MYTNKVVEEKFYNFLKEKGYKEYTPAGKESTLY